MSTRAENTVGGSGVWHPRENAITYLATSEQAQWPRPLQWAYDRPTPADARRATPGGWPSGACGSTRFGDSPFSRQPPEPSCR